VTDQEFANILATIGNVATKLRWQVKVIDGEQPKARPTAGTTGRSVGYAPILLPDTWRDGFTHLYERDAQIEVMISAVRAGIDSNFENRFHVCLFGPPACGKSEIARALGKVVGEDAILEYDATATTQAGAIKDLDEREELPRILIVEEIEKAPEDALRWMLGVLDMRAEIRKTNFKVNIHKEVRMLCVATANDYGLFKKMMYGALASRFSHHVYCGRPGRALMEKILLREVSKVNGNSAWIPPTLDFCATMEIDDPRNAIAICLCGRDDLMSGAYQKRLLECREVTKK
jgi:ATPase family associated with various cellular activities (AAA)